jgi:alcohol dehydrogenase
VLKAVVIHQHGGPEELSFEDFPDPVAGEGEVLVAVRAVALNYLDIFTRQGMPGIEIAMPMITGGDIAGEIVALGPRAEDWRIGDRVSIYPIDRVAGGMYGETLRGGLCEYMAIPTRQLLRIPDGLSYERAAALPVAYGTALRMMVTRGQVKPDERVLILGASGGVGTGCVQIAKMLGAEVVACAGSAAKAERLSGLGADHVINYNSEDIVEACARRFGKRGIDVAVNFTGGDTWAASLRTLKYHGRQLTCGATAGFDPPTDIRYIWTFELNVIGSNGWSRGHQSELLDLTAVGKIDPVIDRVLPLSEAREAERLLEDREVFGKVLLQP